MGSSRRVRKEKRAVTLFFTALIILFGYRALFQEAQPAMEQENYGGSPLQHAEVRQPADVKDLNLIPQADAEPGAPIDAYKGVTVYSNGEDYMSSHGLHFSEDGTYYYGYKWQCVEFVKRFYYQVYGHVMPDGAGNAKYFFNPMLAQGKFNEQRGLWQYYNDGSEKPKADDLLVFTDGKYGHVAIISHVDDTWLEVVQQNSELSRDQLKLTYQDGKWSVSGSRTPAGWLRYQ